MRSALSAPGRDDRQVVRPSSSRLPAPITDAGHAHAPSGPRHHAPVRVSSTAGVPPSPLRVGTTGRSSGFPHRVSWHPSRMSVTPMLRPAPRHRAPVRVSSTAGVPPSPLRVGTTGRSSGFVLIESSSTHHGYAGHIPCSVRPPASRARPRVVHRRRSALSAPGRDDRQVVRPSSSRLLAPITDAGHAHAPSGPRHHAPVRVSDPPPAYPSFPHPGRDDRQVVRPSSSRLPAPITDAGHAHAPSGPPASRARLRYRRIAGVPPSPLRVGTTGRSSGFPHRVSWHPSRTPVMPMLRPAPPDLVPGSDTGG